MTVGVDPGAQQGVHVHDPAALADLEHQGISGQEGVGAGVEWAGAEVGDLGVELGGHDRDLGLRQPGDAEGLDELLHPAGRDTEQVARGDHRGQGALGAATALEQPDRFGTVGDRDREIDQHPSRIVPGLAAASTVEGLGQLGGQRRLIGQVGQQPGPGVRHDPGSVRGHRDLRTGRCSLHLESASRSDLLGPQQTKFLLVKGRFRLSRQRHADRLMKSQG